MAGSSSSMPISGEANPYPYPSHVFVPNFVSVKLSGPDTYDVWKMQMMCLLESHDMLGFIPSHTLGKEKVDDLLWRRSDALVKGWILGSLSQKTLKYVFRRIPNKDFTAKDVWDELQTYYSCSSSISVSVKLSGKDTYDVWEMQMRCLLESYDMLGFVSSHALGKEKIGDLLWRRSDALVKTLILDSLSQQTLKNVVDQIPNKDFTAKDVWDKLQDIYSCSSSSLPSSGEANPYPYPSHVSAPNFVTVKLSGRDTYYVWQMQMRCLLQSHDMLAFISSQSHALGKEKVGDDDMLWRRSDALVKGWILGSLSQQTLENVVKQIPKKDFTAIEVWDKLQSLYGPPAVQDDAAAEGGDFVCEIEKLIKKMLELEDLEEVKKAEAKKIRLAEKLHAAILHQHFWVVERILDDKIVTLRDKITINDNTALHVAVGTSSNNKEFFEKMLNLATKDNEQSLDMRNSEGSTLLHVAAIVGNTEAAKILVERNKDLLYVKDNEERTPVDRALSNMHSDTFIYLLDNYLKFQDVEKGDLVDSTEILVNAISSKDYDSAYKMIRFMRDPEPVLMAIAQNFPPKVNFLESMLLQVKRCMTLLFSHVPAMFKFVEAAQRKAEAYRNAKLLVRITCDLMIRASTTTSTTFNDVIFEATKQNAVKVVKIIVSQFPNAILGNNEDDHNIIQYAVINRSEKVYNLLYQMREHKNIYRTIKDPYENNLLHLAARLAPKNKLNPISGAALQLQRELQWFKEVERFVCPLNVIEKNYFEKTPQMVFAKEHKKLLIEGEKWMKETAQSYTITAALITTIVFAAAITVPGGNKQENGIPVFTNNVAFNVFAISDAISFFTSVTSLLMFLSILTARFSEKDFLFKLPTKLIIGLVNLFISTTAMLVAFGATLFLVFGQKNSWIVGPIAALTCLPIASFIFLQFPLIYDLISATYGRSMFGKRSNAPLIY